MTRPHGRALVALFALLVGLFAPGLASALPALGPKLASRVSTWWSPLASGLDAPGTQNRSGFSPSPAAEPQWASVTFQGLARELRGDTTPGGGELLSAMFRDVRPGLGRWTSRDPGGMIDGPNRYRWNRSNPLRFFDPTGLQGLDFFGWDKWEPQDFDWVEGKNIETVKTAVDVVLITETLAPRRAAAEVAERFVKTCPNSVGSWTDFLAAARSRYAEAAAKYGADDVFAMAVDPNKLRHIFGKAAHKLAPVLAHFGGNEAAAFIALEAATQAAVQAGGFTSGFLVVVNVGGHAVTVTGKVVNGIARIGTAFIP